MTTLAEKMASLTPERRARVEKRANELIAEERARRAKRGAKRLLTPGNGRRVHTSVKPYYVCKAVRIGVNKRSFRAIRRSRRTGYRRYLRVAR